MSFAVRTHSSDARAASHDELSGSHAANIVRLTACPLPISKIARQTALRQCSLVAVQRGGEITSRLIVKHNDVPVRRSTDHGESSFRIYALQTVGTDVQVLIAQRRAFLS